MKLKIDATKRGLNFVIAMADNLVLAAIALGTLTLAMQLSYDLYFDFVNQHDHDLPYMVSELMFVLIVMELFRQVVRQIRKEPFSLKPYLTIGIIASVRGLLIVEMKAGLGDVEWTIGALVIITFAVTILLLVVSYHFCHKLEVKQLWIQVQDIEHDIAAEILHVYFVSTTKNDTLTISASPYWRGER